MLSARADWLVWRWLAELFSSLGSQRASWTSLPPHYGQLRGDCGVPAGIQSFRTHRLLYSKDSYPNSDNLNDRTQFVSVCTRSAGQFVTVSTFSDDQNPGRENSRNTSRASAWTDVDSWVREVSKESSELNTSKVLYRILVTFFSIASYYFAIAQ